MRFPKTLRCHLRFAMVFLVTFMAVSPPIGAQLERPVTQLTLTQALTQAIECGPAFRDQARLQERQRLDLLSEQNANRPNWQLTAGAVVDPTLRSGATANMSWKLSDSLALRLNLPLGVLVTTMPGTGVSRKSLSLDWSHALWPSEDHTLNTHIEAYQKRVAQLDLEEQYFNAVLDVIVSFHQLGASVTRADLAQRSLQLAEGRAEDALHRYENGLIGLGTLQDEQRLHHQALVALQRALLEQEQAYERLTRLMGGTACVAFMDDAGATAHPSLEDDLDWDGLVQGIATSLDVPIPVSTRERGASIAGELSAPNWEESLLSNSSAYQRARIGELQGRADHEAAAGRLLPALSAGASVSSDLEWTKPDWSVGVNALWDLGSNRYVERDRARLDLEAAEDHLAQARDGALEAGRAAWLAISDAMYALELAERTLEEARQTESIVQKRVLAGFAPAVEEVQARLEVDRRNLEYGQAQADLWQAWLRLGRRLGLAVVDL